MRTSSAIFWEKKCNISSLEPSLFVSRYNKYHLASHKAAMLAVTDQTTFQKECASSDCMLPINQSISKGKLDRKPMLLEPQLSMGMC